MPGAMPMGHGVLAKGRIVKELHAAHNRGERPAAALPGIRAERPRGAPEAPRTSPFRDPAIPLRDLAVVASNATDAAGGTSRMAHRSSLPPHPGTVLRTRVLPGLGLSVTRAARELGVCRQTLHRVLAGTAAVTPDMAVRLARLTGVASRFWLDLQQAHDLLRAEADLGPALAQIPAHALPPTLAKELSAHGR